MQIHRYIITLLYLLVIPALTAPKSSSLNSTIPNALPEYKCTNLPSWADLRFTERVQEGCRRAFAQARSTEERDIKKKFEFVPNNWPGVTGLPVMDTPRRYNSEGCTVAIVMLSYFDAEDLPGQPPARPRYSRDVATFRDIFRAGQFVYEACVKYGRPPQAGWNNAGEDMIPI